MTLLIIVAAAIATTLLVTRPLLGGTRTQSSTESHVLEVYREQLAQTDQDLERGLISAEEAETSRIEVKRRILSLAENTGTSPREATRGAVLWPGVGLSILIPVAALGIYLSQGSPHFPSRPDPTNVAVNDIAGTTRDHPEISELAASLGKNPDDLRSWISLAEALSRLKRHEQAGIAYSYAARLEPDNATWPSLQGQQLVIASEGQVSLQAEAAFSEALKRNPGEPRARYFLGLADRQAGRLDAAMTRWQQLLAESPPNASWIRLLQQQITVLAAEMGSSVDPKKAVAGQQPPPPGPSRDDIEAAAQMSQEDRDAMIRSMVDSLANRLASDPDDVQGWLRLAHARLVLGEKEPATAAWKKAAALQPDNAGILLDWAEGLISASSPDLPDPAELDPLLEDILALEPENRRGLQLAGAYALAKGNRNGAVTHWTKLLELLDPGDPAYVRWKRQLDLLAPDQSELPGD